MTGGGVNCGDLGERAEIFQETLISCIRMSQVISGGWRGGGGGLRTSCTLPLDPPLARIQPNAELTF